MSNIKDATNHFSVPTLVTWHPSKDFEIILNVDSSNFGKLGRSGFGGLLRTNEGQWLCCFSGNIGILNNLHAELLGLLPRLMSCDKCYCIVKSYSDSAHTLQLVFSDFNNWHYYVIKNGKYFLLRNWRVYLYQTLR